MGLFSRKREEVAEVIDLREPEPAPRPRWGAPIPCPECSGRGYLDHIDPFRQVMFMHCTHCFSKYEVARTDLDFVDDSAQAFTL